MFLPTFRKEEVCTHLTHTLCLFNISYVSSHPTQPVSAPPGRDPSVHSQARNCEEPAYRAKETGCPLYSKMQMTAYFV